MNDPPVRALTLYQPWAWAIATGVKAHETRSWPTAYRGWLMVHAASRKPDDALTAVLDAECRQAGGPPMPQPLPGGRVVALAVLTSVRPTDFRGPDWHPCARPADALDAAFGDWRPGRYAWALGEVVALREPVPAAGKRGLWTPDRGLVAACFRAAGLAAPDAPSRLLPLFGEAAAEDRP